MFKDAIYNKICFKKSTNSHYTNCPSVSFASLNMFTLSRTVPKYLPVPQGSFTLIDSINKPLSQK